MSYIYKINLIGSLLSLSLSLYIYIHGMFMVCVILYAMDDEYYRIAIIYVYIFHDIMTGIVVLCVYIYSNVYQLYVYIMCGNKKG